MRAFAIESYGEIDVLLEFDLPLPELTDEEVLIEVENTGISPYDWHVRRANKKEKLIILCHSS